MLLLKPGSSRPLGMPSPCAGGCARPTWPVRRSRGATTSEKPPGRTQRLGTLVHTSTRQPNTPLEPDGAPEIQAIWELGPRAELAGSAPVGQLLVLAAVAAAPDRLVDVAELHLATVDVDRDRRLIGRVLDHVVLERRDEGTRLAHSGHHDRFALELDDVLLGVATVDRERGDADLPAVDALDAPDAGVVVERCALADVPHHGEHGVAVAGRAMD